MKASEQWLMMAYSDVYGVDYGPRYLLAGDAERRAQRDLWELQNRNLGDALYDLEELAARRTRREYQWSRLRTRYGVYLIHLCTPGNNRETWSRVKGALKRRRFQQQ
mgnify:CR=1 FL=1